VTEDRPPAFRLDCGATWLNLLATSGRTFSAHPEERIATAQRLNEWLARCELSPIRPPDAADLEQAVWLRETLRALALATLAAERPSQDAVRALSAFLADHAEPEGLRLIVGDRLMREPPADTAAALTRIARQAVDQLTGADRHILAVCPEQDCRGVFADPGGRRRWCPSPSCASRGRVRAHRARLRAAQIEANDQD
jgi:predicted RNA-binding Zn ribbon-like protein